jgi:hypothetical protein
MSLYRTDLKHVVDIISIKKEKFVEMNFHQRCGGIIKGIYGCSVKTLLIRPTEDPLW